MSIVDSLHAKLWSRYHRKAKARAMKDPRYAEIERERHTWDGVYDPDRGLSRWLGGDGEEEQHAIFRRLNPTPWWHRAYWRYGRLRQTKRLILDSIQRAKRGYSQTDVWNLHTYLERVIADATADLAERAHSWPGEPMTYEEWQEILRTISAGFRAASQRDDLILNGPDHAAMEQKLDVSFALLSTYWFSLWD